MSASECPGIDAECSWRLCLDRQCAVAYALRGEVVGAQVPADCAEVVCDGVGGTMPIDDPTDIPADGNACTADLCENGVPANPNLPRSTLCDQDGGSLCDGEGHCVPCRVDNECPGYGTECGSNSCNTSNGKCASPKPLGTPATTQTPKDCMKGVCDGAGAVIDVADDDDLPIDGNPCTDDVCTGGVPSNPALTGLACNSNGGRVCSSAGACVECLEPAHCPGTEDACHVKTCPSGTHVCGWQDPAAGQPIADQVAGDCKRIECTAAHTLTTVTESSDTPADEPNPCTAEVCNGDVPGHQLYPAWTHLCQGAHVCNGAGTCVACTRPSECPGEAQDCASPTCAGGNCGYENAPENTPVTTGQIEGDCKVKVCDGQGHVRERNADDPASDNNGCTTDACSGTTTTHTPKTRGTPCSEGSNGHYCDGGESCVECLQDSHCGAQVCHNTSHACADSACDDGVKNANETGVDCGGPCASCPSLIVLVAGSGSADFMTGHIKNGDTAWTTGTLAGNTDRQPALAVAGIDKAVAAWRAPGTCLAAAPWTCPALRYSVWNGTAWATPSQLGGNETRNRPQAVAVGGKVHLIFHGGNFKHYYAAYDTSWSPLGEAVSNGATPSPLESYGPTPAAITIFDGRPMVAHVGDAAPHDVYDRTRNATGSIWSAPHAQGLTSGAWWDQNDPIPPAIVTMSSGTEAMIALVRTNRQVMWAKGAGSTWTYADVANALAKQVALVALSAGGALLVFQGTDDQLYWSRYNGTGWSVVGKVDATNNPAVTTAPSLAPGIGADLAELAYVSGGAVYHARFDSTGTWVGLTTTPGPRTQVGTATNLTHVAIASFTP